MKGEINDPKYKGWTKMRHVHRSPDGTNIVVHYWKNDITGVIEGAKFK